MKECEGMSRGKDGDLDIRKGGGEDGGILFGLVRAIDGELDGGIEPGLDGGIHEGHRWASPFSPFSLLDNG